MSISNRPPQSLEHVSDLIDCGTGLVWHFTGSEMLPVKNEFGMQKHLVCEDPDREPAYRGYCDKADSQDRRTQMQRRYLAPWP